MLHLCQLWAAGWLKWWNKPKTLITDDWRSGNRNQLIQTEQSSVYCICTSCTPNSPNPKTKLIVLWESTVNVSMDLRCCWVGGLRIAGLSAVWNVYIYISSTDCVGLLLQFTTEKVERLNKAHSPLTLTSSSLCILVAAWVKTRLRSETPF